MARGPWLSATDQCPCQLQTSQGLWKTSSKELQILYSESLQKFHIFQVIGPMNVVHIQVESRTKDQTSKSVREDHIRYSLTAIKS